MAYFCPNSVLDTASVTSCDKALAAAIAPVNTAPDTFTTAFPPICAFAANALCTFGDIFVDSSLGVSLATKYRFDLYFH